MWHFLRDFYLGTTFDHRPLQLVLISHGVVMMIAGSSLVLKETCDSNDELYYDANKYRSLIR